MHRDIRASLTTAGRIALLAPVPAIVVLAGTAALHPALSGLERLASSMTALAALAGGVGLAAVLRRMKRDIAEVEVLFAEHSRRLTHDEGTGALLRRFFLEACEAEIAKDDGRPMAYFAVDMDFLKQLNDSLGHEAGDAALRQLVSVIRKRVPQALIGRLGGDEFAFLAPCADEEAVSDMAALLFRDLARPFQFAGKKLALSATIGVTLLPEQTRFIAEAVQFSDLALYEGKKAGRNRATLFNRKMLTDFRQERQIEREILVGLERGQFALAYQPMRDLDGETMALRASIEWESAWLGKVDRALFVTIAESSTLIDRLGGWAIDRALADAARLHDLPIAVPVSASQLRRDEIVASVTAALRDHGVEPRRIILEFSGIEAALSGTGVSSRLKELAMTGVQISVDSFWPIFAEDEAKQLPIDAIRIPQRYVENLGAGGKESVIVAAVGLLADTSGVTLVAEGATTQSEIALARAARCTILTEASDAPSFPIEHYLGASAKADVEAA